MASEHVLFAPQTVDWKTWTPPTMAIPVSNFDPDLGITYREHRATGSGRALARAWFASKAVTGSLSMAGWQEYLGFFVKQALMHDVKSTTPVGATVAKLHGFVPKDDTMPLGLSVQAIRNGVAQSFKGVLFNTLAFNCAAGEELTLDMDWIARDEALAGGTWLDDGAAAPAAIVPAYFPADTPAFMFYGATLTVGGTPTFNATDNRYTIAGGTAYDLIEMAEVTVENNLDARIFWGAKVPKNAIGQNLAVSGRFDVDQSVLEDAFYLMHREGTRAALSLKFEGTEIEAGHKAALEIVLPNIYISQGKLPALTGENDRRVQSVEFAALADNDGRAIAVAITDSQATY